ncbi:MAG: sigma-70 family RNA polymerase sigma factor [Candidatus Acidiferrales bacterium]
MTEPEMIARVLAGERNVFHDLIRPYEKMVYLTALSILKDQTEAEETAQDAMISAFRHLATFRAESKFSTWLVTIAVNGARQKLRSAKRAVLESIDERLETSEGDYTPAFLTDWREVPLAALERQELRDTLRTAVAELPEIYREVFTLRDVEEMNVQETAQALGLSENVVKVRLHRARMLLQKRLVPLLKTSAPPRRGLFGRRP